MEICEVVGSVFGRPRAPEANDKCRPFESSSPSAAFGRSGKLLGIVALALVVLGVILYRSEQPLQNSPDTLTKSGDESIRLSEPLRPRYSPIALPADQPLAPAMIFDSSLALSPDGNLLVYRGMEGSSVRLYQRRLGQLGGAVLEGTSRADRPFFSPDGEWIGYIGGYDGGLALLKMPVAGGPSELIQKLTIAFPAHWGDDDHIVYTPSYGSGLMRISEDGGEPVALTTLEEGAGGHSFPFVLPGSKAVLYTSFTRPTVETAKLMLYDRETNESRLLFDQAGGGKYIETGHLVYSQRGRLMAAPFDLDSLAVTGPSFEITDLRMVEPDGTPNRHAISSVGTFAYVPVGMDAANGLSLIWVDLNGNETDLGAPRAGYQDISIAPNGRDALVEIWNGQDAAIWLYDLERSTAMRLTFSPSHYNAPRWMNDGYRFFYTSNRTGNWVLHLANLDDPDNPEAIVGFQNGSPLANSVTADQRAVIFTFTSPNQQNLMIVDLDEEGAVRPLLESSYNKAHAALSSDGKWIAYASDESGEWQVYMRSYPEMTGKTRVSIDGGQHPEWSPDGKTLYFYAIGSTVKIMAVPLSFDPSLRPGTPHVIYEGDIVRAALHPDGDRFLVVKQPISGELRVGGREIIVVENWFEEVRRRERVEVK